MGCLVTKVSEFVIEDQDLAEYYTFVKENTFMGNFYFDDLMDERPKGAKYHKERLTRLIDLGLVYGMDEESMECNHIVAYNLADPDEIYDVETITPYLEDDFFNNHGIEMVYLNRCPHCGENSGIEKLKEKFFISIKEKLAS